MSKFYGTVGFAITEEKMEELDGEPVGTGKWVNRIVEHGYSCEEIKSVSKWSTSSGVNDNVDINNQISILADPFAYDNCSYIRYLKCLGSCWKVTAIEHQRPRLILTVGGIWNGEQAETTERT